MEKKMYETPEMEEVLVSFENSLMASVSAEATETGQGQSVSECTCATEQEDEA